MRVLYFHQHFSTPAGAAGLRSYEMARALIARGHEVTMVCGRYAGGDTGLTSEFVRGRRAGQVDGINVIEFDLPYSNEQGFVRRSMVFLDFALRSVLLALTAKYDVVFATTTPLTAAVPGVAARWLRGKRFVFEVRDLWPELPRAMGVIRNPIVLQLLDTLELVAYRSAHRLVGLAPGIVRGIASRGVSPAKIALIPNGCDLDIFNSPDAQWRPVGVDEGDLMAVFTGTHGLANGLDAVLDAAAVLKTRGRRDIKLVLIGRGSMKAALQGRAEREALTNVVFHDPVNKFRLAGLLAAADVGLQVLANVPVFYDGTSPNKFFDYIASSLPVLNNYPGWLADLIGQHGCGYAVTPDNPDAFADALEHAADNRDSLAIMGNRARALAEMRFDRRALAADFVGWLEAANA